MSTHNDDFSDPLQASSQRYTGASSLEDFWMFFAFAMILLVFVLMNYVNYLYAMVVEAPEEFMASVPIENSAGADAGEDAPVEIRIYVKQAGDRIVYTFADEDTRELSLAELTAGLESRTAAAMPGAMIKVFIHASGDVMFQHVFNASFPAWKLGKGGTGQRTGALNLDVHLVYEERQPDK